MVSYRSVPRILEIFKQRTTFVSTWIPHFTSVINWTLCLGLGLLKQVQPMTEPWVAIIDHSIDIGTKKAMVVLRIGMDALSKRGGAIQLSDCECIGLTVSEKVNGESIATELNDIFAVAGKPLWIVKDADATLQKGTRLCCETDGAEGTVHVIDDIGHVMANAIKKEYEKTSEYKRFTSLVSHGSKCLRQTNLAFIIPPKLRSKGRFQSISNVGKWATKMLAIFAVKGRAKEGSLIGRLRIAFPDLIKSRRFIEHFSRTTIGVSQVMKILKNKGLDKTTYKQCYALSKELPRNSTTKKCLQSWLKQNREVQKQIMPSMPLLVSSDIIESLFGHFKHIIERSPQADMNRSVLLIPALCGTLSDKVVTQALKQTSQNDLKLWEDNNISYTVRKQRQAFFNGNVNPKNGELLCGF